MPKEPTLPESVREWYHTVRTRIEEGDEESLSMIKFLAVGAGATVAVGSVIMGMYRLLGTSERGLEQKMRHSRLRLLGSRRKHGRATAAALQEEQDDADEEAASTASAAAPETMSPGRIFEQFRAAYVEDKELHKHTGGCHCGRVRFIVEAPAELQCIDSDRNMYTLKGRFPHVVVPKGRVVLLTSTDHLGVYHFGNLPVGPVQEVFEFQNLFCKTCGVHCFGYNKAKDTMHVNSMALDMDTVREVSVAFECDRSSWRIMNPLLYHPSFGDGSGNGGQDDGGRMDAHDDARTGTYVPTPWKVAPPPAAAAAAGAGGAYDDLSSLGVAAGVLHDGMLGFYGAGLAPLPAKPEPLLATHAGAGGTGGLLPGKRLFSDDFDDTDTRMFFEAAATSARDINAAGSRLILADDDDDDDYEDGGGGCVNDLAANAKTVWEGNDTDGEGAERAYSVERLRRHLSKHVPDDAVAVE